MKHLKKFNESAVSGGSMPVDIANLSSTMRANNANPAVEFEEEMDHQSENTLNVYSVSVEGMDMMYYIVAAKSVEDVKDIVQRESMVNYIDSDDIYQIEELQTNLKESTIIAQF